jgi:hypothetical protein
VPADHSIVLFGDSIVAFGESFVVPGLSNDVSGVSFVVSGVSFVLSGHSIVPFEDSIMVFVGSIVDLVGSIVPAGDSKDLGEINRVVENHSRMAKVNKIWTVGETKAAETDSRGAVLNKRVAGSDF